MEEAEAIRLLLLLPLLLWKEMVVPTAVDAEVETPLCLSVSVEAEAVRAAAAAIDGDDAAASWRVFSDIEAQLPDNIDQGES